VGVACPECKADEPPRLPEGWTSIASVAEDPGFTIHGRLILPTDERARQQPA
jgi:hypothetical protein